MTAGHLNIEQKQVKQSHSSDQTMSHLSACSANRNNKILCITTILTNV